MSNELKPCPFCGASAVIENDYGREYWAQCTDLECGATDGALSKSPTDAANYWNRRPAPAQGALPDALPELPKPVRMSSDQSYLGYSADQMHAYAKQYAAAIQAQAGDATGGTL